MARLAQPWWSRSNPISGEPTPRFGAGSRIIGKAHRLAKGPTPTSPESPKEFPQVEPSGVEELFPTNNIRFVIMETGKLIERVDGLSKAVDRLGPAAERLHDKHAADVKDWVRELKDASKTTNDNVAKLKESIDSFKGAMKVMNGVYALVLIIFGAFLTWLLRPAPTQPNVSPQTVQQSATTPTIPATSIQNAPPKP